MHWDTAALASSGSQRSHLELALCDEGHHRSDIPPVRLQTKARRTRDATRSAPLPTDHAKPCTQRDFSLPLHYSTHLAGSTPHRPRTAVHTARLLTALALQHPPRRRLLASTRPKGTRRSGAHSVGLDSKGCVGLLLSGSHCRSRSQLPRTVRTATQLMTHRQ